MKEIQLTQGKVVLVDDENYERLNQVKWCALLSRGKYYAVRGIYKKGKIKRIYMHREIINVPCGIYTDHINGDTLDNRKENLRLCTHQQNCFNRKNPHKDNRLGIKGVWWNKQNKKFRAQIQLNDKSIHLGYFNVIGDADSAYRKAEEKYFGEFTRKGQ